MYDVEQRAMQSIHG